MSYSINIVQQHELRNILGDEYDNLVEAFFRESVAYMRVIQSAFEESENSIAAIALASLKGVCTNLGATNLATFCQKLLIASKENRFQHSEVLLHVVQEELKYVIKFFRQEIAFKKSLQAFLIT
jgi:HPt (histidine-containing phosphotransfer) domain-containing protein